MKKLLTLILLIYAAAANGQNEDSTKIWQTSLQGSLTFSQVSLSNWAGGGDNTIALNSFLKIFANRKINRSNWENSLNLAYGLTKIGDQALRKSDDKVDLTSKYGYQLSASSDNLFFSSSFTFRSQFDNGFKFPNDSARISKFLAPGYIIVSTGIDYQPQPYISISFSPVTGKATIVNDELLSSLGAFGVKPGEKARLEFGSFLKLVYNKEVLTNVNFETKLDLFSNYAHPGDIDVNWENALVMKVNDFMSANLLTHLIYDKDIKFDVIENDVVVRQEDNVQFKQVFGIGLTFKI